MCHFIRAFPKFASHRSYFVNKSIGFSHGLVSSVNLSSSVLGGLIKRFQCVRPGVQDRPLIRLDLSVGGNPLENALARG